jgi:enoyl-[acyl-carrier protein] reductase I
VMGVANDRSLAWGIAKAVQEAGAELAFSYQGEALGRRVRPLAESIGSDFLVEADVTSESSLDAVFAEVDRRWGALDFLIHAIAFSDKEELKGQYLQTTRDNFLRTLDISCFSFTDLCRRAAALMHEGGSLVTLTYAGAERVMPHYNVMGVAKAALEASVKYLAVDLGGRNIRVNAISAGPVRTLAARSIAGFPTMESIVEERSPLHRHVDAEDVAAAAGYLLSDGARNVTGTTLYVDSGYHSMGM